MEAENLSDGTSPTFLWSRLRHRACGTITTICDTSGHRIDGVNPYNNVPCWLKHGTKVKDFEAYSGMDGEVGPSTSGLAKSEISSIAAWACSTSPAICKKPCTIPL